MIEEQGWFTTYRTFTNRMLGLFVLAYVLVAEPPKLVAPWLTEAGKMAGFVLLAVAAFGRLWCLMFIAGKKNNTLVTEGPYSVVRNPLYVFSFAGVVGFGLAVENPLLTAALVAFFAASYPVTVAQEEKHLSSLFGSAYTAYCTTTPRWIPDWRLYHEPKVLTVCPERIRHGIFDAMWFLWAFLLWQVLEAFRRIGFLHTWF